MDKKTVIVTGGSSGIGLATARQLVQDGWSVYEFSRRDFLEEGIRHIPCDVTDEQAVIEAVKEVLSNSGRLDCVINCAGFGISGAIEYTDINEAHRQFDVNFFGMVNVNKACIPYLKQTKGRIINISSVAAMAAIPFQSFYSASKAAINSYTLALANELAPFGIKVSAVMPGDTSTGFTAARRKNTEGDQEYAGRISRSLARMEKDELSGMSAADSGRFVAAIANGSSHKPLYTIGLQYKAVIVLLKLLPAKLANYIIGKMYAS